MSKDSPWTTILSAAGAAGAGIAFVYAIGGMVMSMRYGAFGLTGQQSISYTPREVLLVAGVRSLAIWAILGGILVLVVARLPDRVTHEATSWLARPPGIAVVTALAVGLFLLLHVLWPLLALGAVIIVVATALHWRDRRTLRLLVCVAVIAAVAVAYESDRIHYYADWTCIEVSTPEGASVPFGMRPLGPGSLQACGLLIGENGRGYYIGSQGLGNRPDPEGPEYRILFIPAGRVIAAHSQKQYMTAIDNTADERREPLRSRIWGVHVR